MIDKINLILAQQQVDNVASLLKGEVNYYSCYNHRGEHTYKIEITYEDPAQDDTEGSETQSQ